MASHTRPLSAALLCALVATTAGCSTNRRGPISTSLTGLISESRTFDGPVLRQSELISIGGLLPTPAPGLIYHMVNESEQQSLLGISYDAKSFVLIGESLPKEGDIAQIVSDLKETIEAQDRAQSQMLEEVARVYSLELQRASLTRPAKTTVKPETSTEESRLASQVATAASMSWLQSLNAEIEVSNDRIRSLKQQIGENIETIRNLSANPGVLIARWQKNTQGGVDVGAVPFAEAGVSRDVEVGGYVILGGVRVVVPFLSGDFVTMFLDIEETNPGSIGGLQYAGVTTFLLQAKEVAYTNSFSGYTAAKLKAAVAPAQLVDSAALLASLQKVTFEAEFLHSQRNVSGGRMGNFHWRTIDLEFSDRWLMPPSKRDPKKAMEKRGIAQDKLLGVSGANPSEPFDPDPQWTTVIAQVISPGRFANAVVDISRIRGIYKYGDVAELERVLLEGAKPILTREPDEPAK